jgi:ARC6-like, IMS domain
MLEKSSLIARLEDKIDELHRDRTIARKVVGGNSSLLIANTAIEEYVALKQDSSIVLGIRYLALSCVAAQYQLCHDEREVSRLKELTGQETDVAFHIDILNSIGVIRSRYQHIYECNAREFDRIERLTKEISPSLDEWGRAIPKIHSNQGAQKNQDSDINSTATNSTVFTEAEVETLLEKERSNNTKSISIALWILCIMSGIGMYLIVKQQLPSTSSNSPSTTTSISNSSRIDIPTPSPQISQGQPTLGSVETLSTKMVQDEAAISSPEPFETLSPQISQDEAVSLIQRWLDVKKSLFAPPFDRDSATALTTGKIYKDKVRGPSTDGTPYSSSEWLEKYGFYYSYNLQRIDNIKSFEVTGNSAVIYVQLTEDISLYNSKGELQELKSGLEQKTIRYILVKEDGILKISDYNNLTTSKRTL